MQPGDRPVLEVTVKGAEFITVIKIGHYTTIELDLPQMFNLLECLQRIKDSHRDASYKAIDRAQRANPALPQISKH